MARHTEGVDLLGHVVDGLSGIRFRLLTSIESESGISEFLDALRMHLNLGDLALYLVNPQHQTVERGPRLGIFHFKAEQRQSLNLNSNTIPSRAAATGRAIFGPILDESSADEREIWNQPRAELGIPIKKDQQVIGVLHLIIPDRTQLAECHRQALDLVVVDLAATLTNLRVVHGLRNRISTDEVTGLYNSRYFLEGIEVEIKRANRNDSPLGILFLEVDQVPGISVKHGYAALDSVMLHVAKLLRKNSRATDLLARFSDTGFTIALGGTDIDESLFVAEKHRKLIAQECSQDLGPVSMSIGVAVYPVHATQSEELMLAAQQAAKLARFSGGNQVSMIGSDRMKMMALKAFERILADRYFHTGPEIAAEVVTHLEEVSTHPIYSPLVRQIVESLASAIDAKDHYTKSHSEEATVYAEALGRACHIADKRLELVKMAAKLHDLGKIGVPEHILNKCGPLDEQEWKIMKEHPTIGARILKPIQSLADLVPIVQYHHERWNGSGYPVGLKGIQIPLEARIIGVIDSFHAIISERPYKKAMSATYALDELKRQAGIIFDAHLVERFCSLFDLAGNLLASEVAQPIVLAENKVEPTD